MFEWLTQLLGRSKQRTKELPTGEVSAPVVEGKASKPGSSDSLRSLLKTAIADAEQIAASIKMRAQAEAEAEAARIITQAKLESQEIKGRAEIAAQREAENILSGANRKAEIAEVETKQKVLQFLIRASGEVEKEIKEEYQRTYSRLSSSLQDLMNEGQNIEMELKGRVAKLLESQALELKGLETMLLSTTEAVVSSVKTSAPAETELKPDISRMEKVEEAVQLEEKALAEKVEEAVEPEAEPKIEIEEAKRAKEDQKKAKKEAQLIAKEEAKSKAEEAKRAKEAEKKAKEETRLIAKVEALEEKVEEAVQPEEKALEKREAAPVELDSQALYTGEVELLIVPLVELKLVSRLYNYLQTVPELRVLYTRGSWNQGTTIIVVLDNPLPLISILLETPDVKVIPELLEKEGMAVGKSSSLLRGGEQRVKKKIKLILKEA